MDERIFINLTVQRLSAERLCLQSLGHNTKDAKRVVELKKAMRQLDEIIMILTAVLSVKSEPLAKRDYLEM